MAVTPGAPRPVGPGARQPSLGAYLQRLIWISMLPLLAVAVYLAGDSVQQLRAADDRAMQQLAGQIAANLDQFVQVRMDALAALSRSPLLDDPRTLADFHRAAQSIRRTFGSHLILADATGQMLVHTGQPFGSALPQLARPGGQAAVPRALASGKPETGDRFTGPIGGELLVAVAVPVPAGPAGAAPGRVLPRCASCSSWPNRCRCRPAGRCRWSTASASCWLRGRRCRTPAHPGPTSRGSAWTGPRRSRRGR
jgi:hypothetical protein